jgi:gliding motility-associated-like protein
MARAHHRRLLALAALLGMADAQAQLSKWPIRTGSGEVRLIDLSSAEPVVGSLIPSFGLGGTEDVNLMTDAAGNVLFITAVDSEGKISVRKLTGELLSNGAGLLGNSSSQASAIVPRPCHPGQYYFIHHDTDAHRHYYSIIDAYANGGQGAVVEKNQHLLNNVGEGMAVSQQLIGGCRWLYTFRVDEAGYRILRARISATGIDEATVIGTCAPSGAAHWWSTLKISPANDRLAVSLPGSAPGSAGDIALWHLDPEAGELSGLQQLAVSSRAISGIEFSPAGRYLYFVSNGDALNNDFGRLNLSTQSAHIIDPAIGWWIMNIECAANGRLYVGARGLGTTTIAEVGQPDADAAVDLAYDPGAITFLGWGMIPSLPNSIEGELPGSAPAPLHAAFEAVAQPDCQGHRFVPKSCNGTAWLWDFGDGWTSQAQEPVHHYGVGTFSVRLRVTACGQTHELLQPDLITVEGIQPIASFTHPDTVCQRAPVGFENASELATAATWFFGDGGMSNAIQPAYAYPQHGTSTITLVARNGCIMDTARSTIVVLPAGVPSFHTNSDPCDERTYFVNTTYGGERFHWDFGDGDSTSSWYHPVHIFQSEGIFEVRLTTDPGNRCENTFMRTLHAGYGIIPVAWYVPSAFSPNADGVNDVLRIKGPEPCQSPVMSIHNRWGQLVWEGDADPGWDGSLNGAPAPDGVYAYALRGRLDDMKHGWVVLVR